MQTIKLLLIGDSMTEKYAIPLLFNQIQPLQHELHDDGVFQCVFLVNSQQIQYRFIVTNVPASDQYLHVRPILYADYDVALLVYSLQDNQSLLNLSCKWLPELLHNSSNNNSVQQQILVVGVHRELMKDESKIATVLSKQQQIVSKLNVDDMMQRANPKYHSQIEFSSPIELSDLFHQILEVNRQYRTQYPKNSDDDQQEYNQREIDGLMLSDYKNVVIDNSNVSTFNLNLSQ